MKNIIKSVTVLSIAAILFLSSCSKSSNDLASNNQSVTNSQNTTPPAFSLAGKWTIGSYTQKAEDKTSTFNGFTFTFSSGANSGTVVASNNNATVNGTWSHQPAVTYYGSSSSESITLNFGSVSPLLKLNKIWNVSSSSSKNLSLISPEVAEDEHLILNQQ